MVEKGFKKPEIGLIPEDWEVKKLGEIFEILKGRGLSKSKLNEYGKFKCILYGELFTTYKEVIKIVKSRTNSEEGQNSKYGDILFPGSTTTTGIDLAKCSTILVDNIKLGGDIIILRRKENNINSEFMVYYLNIKCKYTIAEKTKGVTIFHLHGKDLIDINISYPKYEEQTRIATVLSDTDALIEKLEQLIAKKRNIKTAAMQELLKPKEGWEEKKLGEIANIVKGQLITANTAIPDGIPVIGGGMTISYFHNKPNRTGITITVSASGAYAGYVSIHNYPIFASDCSTINESESYDIFFLYYSLLNKQKEIYGLQTGGGQPHVYPEQLRNLFITIPKSKTEQTRIAQILSDMDNEIQALEKQLEKYKMLKQGMMQVLLTGKIRLVTKFN